MLVFVVSKNINFEALTCLMIVRKEEEVDLIDVTFNKKAFVRTLSYREFVTSFSLCLLLLALFRLLDYLATGNDLQYYQASLKQILFFIVLPGNHVFYKLQHKRSNNFIGRNLHDYIFILILVALYKLERYIAGVDWTFNIKGPGSFIISLILFVVSVMLIEAGVAVLKRFFKLVKWQIL